MVKDSLFIPTYLSKIEGEYEVACTYEVNPKDFKVIRIIYSIAISDWESFDLHHKKLSVWRESWILLR